MPASIVEDWFNGNMSLTDDRNVFIEKIIKPGVTGGVWADIMDQALVGMPLEKPRSFTP
jgi:hypothetical protein